MQWSVPEKGVVVGDCDKGLKTEEENPKLMVLWVKLLPCACYC